MLKTILISCTLTALRNYILLWRSFFHENQTVPSDPIDPVPETTVPNTSVPLQVVINDTVSTVTFNDKYEFLQYLFVYMKNITLKLHDMRDLRIAVGTNTFEEKLAKAFVVIALLTFVMFTLELSIMFLLWCGSTVYSKKRHNNYYPGDFELLANDDDHGVLHDDDCSGDQEEQLSNLIDEFIEDFFLPDEIPHEIREENPNEDAYPKTDASLNFIPSSSVEDYNSCINNSIQLNEEALISSKIAGDKDNNEVTSKDEIAPLSEAYYTDSEALVSMVCDHPSSPNQAGTSSATVFDVSSEGISSAFSDRNENITTTTIIKESGESSEKENTHNLQDHLSFLKSNEMHATSSSTKTPLKNDSVAELTFLSKPASGGHNPENVHSDGKKAPTILKTPPPVAPAPPPVAPAPPPVAPAPPPVAPAPPRTTRGLLGGILRSRIPVLLRRR